ncbi:MAG: hypothetical protein ACLGHN_10105, partial [Bacteriovoracia bacterium]
MKTSFNVAAIFMALSLLSSFPAFGRAWKIDMKDSHLELEIDSEFSSPLLESERPIIRGHFCLKKEKPSKKCQL